MKIKTKRKRRNMKRKEGHGREEIMGHSLYLLESIELGTC